MARQYGQFMSCVAGCKKIKVGQLAQSRPCVDLSTRHPPPHVKQKVGQTLASESSSRIKPLAVKIATTPHHRSIVPSHCNHSGTQTKGGGGMFLEIQENKRDSHETPMVQKRKTVGWTYKKNPATSQDSKTSVRLGNMRGTSNHALIKQMINEKQPPTILPTFIRSHK